MLSNRISSRLESLNSFVGTGGIAYSRVQQAFEQLYFVLLHLLLLLLVFALSRAMP
jgi:hypothetical protein